MSGDGELSIRQGVDFEAIFAPFEDSTYATRTDLAPADWRILLQARRDGECGDFLLNIDSDDAQGRLIVEDATDLPIGKWIRLALKADDTAAIRAPGVWELTRVDRNDVTNVSPLGDGTLKLRKRITDAGS